MSTPFLGEIRIFGYNFAPRGWSDCSGQLLAISQNDALFSLLGTTYGGDGQTTFALPDLRGRIPVHQGQGAGLSSYAIGQMAGTETVTLTAQQIPAHNHSLTASTAAATALTPGNTLLPAAVAGDSFYVSDVTGAMAVPMSTQSAGSAGGSQPHENMMPTMTVRFCIAVEGIYPSRN